MEFSTTKITPNDNVKIPSMNGNNAGYMETDELKEYVGDGLITQSITDGDTTHSPSGDAVNGALNAISGLNPQNIKMKHVDFQFNGTVEVGNTYTIGSINDVFGIPNNSEIYGIAVRIIQGGSAYDYRGNVRVGIGESNVTYYADVSNSLYVRFNMTVLYV